MSYVEGFVAPVPSGNREAYRKHAEEAAEIFRRHGALQVVECWGDDVPDGETTSFPMAVKLTPGETVVFGWIVWASRQARDQGMEKARVDLHARLGGVPMPFDGRRMIFGGFETIVDTSTTSVHRLSPHLVCAGAARAIDFYRRAFGAEEMIRLDGPDGTIMHACLCINGSSVMLVDENPAMGNRAPTSLEGTPVTIHLIVDDADAVAERAAAAGATVVIPVDDMFWGDRYGVLEDPFGHRWAVATPKRRMSEAELREAARASMAG